MSLLPEIPSPFLSLNVVLNMYRCLPCVLSFGHVSVVITSLEGRYHHHVHFNAEEAESGEGSEILRGAQVSDPVSGLTVHPLGQWCCPHLPGLPGQFLPSTQQALP